MINRRETFRRLGAFLLGAPLMGKAITTTETGRTPSVPEIPSQLKKLTFTDRYACGIQVHDSFLYEIPTMEGEARRRAIDAALQDMIERQAEAWHNMLNLATYGGSPDPYTFPNYPLVDRKTRVFSQARHPFKRPETRS